MKLATVLNFSVQELGLFLSLLDGLSSDLWGLGLPHNIVGHGL